MRIGAGANATIVNAPAANTSVAGGPAALENSAQRSAAGREAGVAEGTLSACQCAMMRTN